MLSGLILSAALMVPSQSAPAATPPSAIPPVTIPDLLPKSTTGSAAPTLAQPPAVAAPAATQPVPVPPVIPNGMTPAPVPMETAEVSLRDEHFGVPHSFWGEIDYLRYWMKPAPATVPLFSVVGPGNSTRTLFGTGNFDFGSTDGIRASAGLWLNSRHTLGLQASVILLEQESLFASANSAVDGTPSLFRPFRDALQLNNSQLLVSNPATIAGGVYSSVGSRLSGGDITVVNNLWYERDASLDLLISGKYIDLDESLQVTQVSRPINAGAVVFNNQRFTGNGSPTLTVSDRFRTRNQFYGGTLGLRGEFRSGPIFLNLTGKLGLGNNHQYTQIDGVTAIAVPGQAAIPTGLLAVRGGNAGQYTTNRIALVSEAGAQVGVQLSRSARVMIGYDLLYLSNVARASDQIDPIVNPRLLPTSLSFGTVTGITSPVPTGARDDFYVHGIRLGFEFLY